MSGTDGALALDANASSGGWRRGLMLALVAATTAAGCVLMTHVLGLAEARLLDLALLAVFAPGFAWIALSFWATAIGFALALSGCHPVTLRRSSGDETPRPLRSRTAILMPIYNENPQQAFSRAVSTCRSVKATGQLEAFDFFVLSDTTDERIARKELVSWMSLRAIPAIGPRLFYRRRLQNIGRKAGNIADWVAMYGAHYDHMVILDADSVMAGATIVRLAALMEANPRTGIIQTLCQSVGRETLFARTLQFASRLYGPLSAAGHSFWQLGEANYYGHNAILRCAPFARHCDLPVLSGRAPLGGEILSHDFVEAAFMRRAGWHVWLLPELGGSYEQLPSNLLDYAARDRRWVQGNLQHARLLGAPKLHPVSRLHLAMGILGYVASPLWLAFLLLSGAAMIAAVQAPPAFFGAERTLFPIWPADRALEVQWLLGLTAVLLFGPKAMALVHMLLTPGRVREFGGRSSVLAGAALELVLSMLMAPVMMMLHSTFIAQILSGNAVGWSAQARDDRGVSWGSALDRHGGHMATGWLAAAALGWLAPAYLPWMLPVIAGLVMAAPVTVLTSSPQGGLWALRLGLLVTPEEREAPAELRTLLPDRRRRAIDVTATPEPVAPTALPAAGDD